MKKPYLIFLIVIQSLFLSCSLDFPDDKAISGAESIDTQAKALAILNAAYNAYPAKEQMLFSIRTENFMPTNLLNIDPNINGVYKWEQKDIGFSGNALWGAYYNSIYSINSVLNSEIYISNIDTNPINWKLIKARALGLKAYIYYDLLNLFCNRYTQDEQLGIILKNVVDKEEKVQRSTYAESVSEINKLIEESLAIFESIDANGKLTDINDIGNKAYITSGALKLLQARIALQTKDYSRAIDLAETFLNQGNYRLTDTNEEYKKIFSKPDDSDEVLFYIELKENFYVNLYNSFESGDYLCLHPDMLLQTDDIRNGISYFNFKMAASKNDNPIDRALIGKYRVNIEDLSVSKVAQIRGSELYFIMMEAYFNTGNESKSLELLNTFLKSRKSSSFSNLSGDALLKEIKLQKNIEFVGEPIGFYDAKRWGDAHKIFQVFNPKNHRSIEVDDYRWNFPIPLTEINNNPNVQNRGWENFIIK